MFGVPIEGPNVFCDNEAVRKNTTKPESVLNQKHHSIAKYREVIATGGTGTNLPDLFTETVAAQKRDNLLDKFTY
jgi:tRNA G37 N-methylase TrmD